MNFPTHYRINLAIKRAADLAIAGTVLIFAAPSFALIAVLIKLDDRGPVFFTQQRVGRNRELFRCYKFRTMTAGTEFASGGLNVTVDDARLTRVGKWLRVWTLDELPQLLNILNGDMSLVGPRPWVAAQADQCSAEGMKRFAMRPGLAGWAWIHGRNRLPLDARIHLDVWYVDHWSLWLDCKIFVKAFVLLFRRTGVFSAAGEARATLPEALRRDNTQ